MPVVQPAQQAEIPREPLPQHLACTACGLDAPSHGKVGQFWSNLFLKLYKQYCQKTTLPKNLNY